MIKMQNSLCGNYIFRLVLTKDNFRRIGSWRISPFLATMNENELKIVKESLNLCKNTSILFISTEGDTDKQVFGQIINDNNYTQKHI